MTTEPFDYAAILADLEAKKEAALEQTIASCHGRPPSLKIAAFAAVTCCKSKKVTESGSYESA